MKNKQSGFTLLEILLVVGIIAILAGITIVAINPSKQLAQVRNTERKFDLKQVANAITQFYIDHSYYPASTTFPTTTLMPICPTGASTSPAAGFNCAANNMLNLSELVPTYIVAIPNDPATTTVSGYSVVLVNNNPAVSAPLAELGVTISVGNVPEEVTDACETSGDATDPDCWSTSTSIVDYWGPMGIPTGIQSDNNGAANTTALVAIAGNNYPPAEYCDALDEGDYHDWYLPAKDQLEAGLGEFKTQYELSNINWGGFADETDYWSSTELLGFPEDFAWIGGYYYNQSNFFIEFANKDSTGLKAHCLR